MSTSISVFPSSRFRFPFYVCLFFLSFLFLSCSTKLRARNISRLSAGAELLYRDRADIRPRKPPERSSFAGQAQIYHQHLAPFTVLSFSAFWISQCFFSRKYKNSSGFRNFRFSALNLLESGQTEPYVPLTVAVQTGFIIFWGLKTQYNNLLLLLIIT